MIGAHHNLPAYWLQHENEPVYETSIKQHGSVRKSGRVGLKAWELVQSEHRHRRSQSGALAVNQRLTLLCLAQSRRLNHHHKGQLIHGAGVRSRSRITELNHTAAVGIRVGYEGGRI